MSHEIRHGRFYRHTVLLDEEGRCYGWLNKASAQALVIQHAKEITTERYEGRRAFRSSLRFTPDPFHPENRCIVSGGKEFTLHHVIPDCAFDILSAYLGGNPFYYYVLLGAEHHATVERRLREIYALDNNEAHRCAKLEELALLRRQFGLMKSRSNNRLQYFKPGELELALKSCGWNQVSDIPLLTGPADPRAIEMRQQCNRLQAIEEAELKKAHFQFWRAFIKKHSPSEVRRLFTQPILELNPKFLDPRIVAEWEK